MRPAARQPVAARQPLEDPLIAAIRTRWADIIHGLWFRPGLVVLGFGLLSEITLWLDHTIAVPELVGFGGDASAARAILSTVAMSLMTVAGVSLSITVVTLQLVAGQVSPRAVRGLLSDRTTHLSIGGLFGIFLFCLLVMRAVRGADTGEFVPRLSVTVAIALAVVGLGLLLMFFHRIAVSMRVATIAAEIAHETLGAIDKEFPAPYAGPAQQAEDTLTSWRREGEGERYFSRRPGYVQSIELDGLLRAAAGHRVAVLARPGDFVSPSEPLVELWPAASDRSRMEGAVGGSVHVANEGDIDQDPGYGIRQLVDIALRALSLNDPTTAVTCLSYLRVILERLASRAFPPEVRTGNGGEVTAVIRVREFDDYLSAITALRPWPDPRVGEATASLLGTVRESAAAVGATERVAAVDRITEQDAMSAAGEALPT